MMSTENVFMKNLMIYLATFFITSFNVLASAAKCTDILVSNGVPHSKAIIDCEKKRLIYSEKSGVQEVDKEVPIYGATRPEWMTRNMFNTIKSDCYNNSKPAYDSACAAGYNIGKDGECRLPTYVGGRQVRKKTTPTFSTPEECYKKQGIYDVVGYKKEKVKEDVYKSVYGSYNDIMDGKFKDLTQSGVKVVEDIKKCMEIVGETPRATVGMTKQQLTETPGRAQPNSVFVLCNKHTAASIVKNKECYQEVNASGGKYPVSVNLKWWLPEKTKFCQRLLALKDNKGFIACKEEVSKHSYSREHIQNGLRKYLSFIDGHSPSSPDIRGCLSHPNLKWFSSEKNIQQANKCVKEVLSLVNSYIKSDDISFALKNCYATNTTSTCMSLSRLRNVSFFDLCGEKGIVRFKKSRVNSCIGDVEKKDKAMCQYRCLSFYGSLNSKDLDPMVECKSEYLKKGDGGFQSCFYQVNDKHGGNLNLLDSLAFCPASEYKIKTQLGESTNVIQGIFETLSQ